MNQQKITRVAGTPAVLAAVTTTPLIDRTEIVRYEKGQPRNTLNLAANYEFRKFSFLVREVRYGAVTSVGSNTDFSRDQTFSAKWLTDVDLGYRFTKQFSVNVGANNVFDIRPDQIIASNNPSGFLLYSGISPSGFNGGFYYARADFKF